jgi:hypothetical protein
MPRATARKMVFTEEPQDDLLDILTGATPNPTPAVPPGTNPPPGHPDHHPPRNPPPETPNPRPRPDDPIPYEPGPVDQPPDQAAAGPRNIGEGDDSDVANPDVPGSTPRHPHPKPEDGDPTPDPDPDNPDVEEGEEDIPPGETVGTPLAEAASLDGAGSRPAAAVPLTGEIMPRNARYEARITILDAFHYPGSLRDAPDWVDRNWVGYGDDDPMRGIVAGPCLRVPTFNRMGDVVLARVGDYVTRQEVRLAPGVPGDIRVEVWAKEQFEKMFLPVPDRLSEASAAAA